jgi:tape measure domain-containing protein
MARNIYISIKVKDNFSHTVNTMRSTTQAFNKDLSDLRSELNKLGQKKTTLKVDTGQVKTALADTQKRFSETGKAADKLQQEMNGIDFENLYNKLSAASKKTKELEKDQQSLDETLSKSGNRAGSKSSSGMKDLVSGFAEIGAADLVKDVVGGMATSWISRAYGSNAGTVASSVLSTSITGASIGSIFGPGGTVVGAIGGALVGYLQGKSAIFENKDEYFKGYYQELYTNSLETQNQALTSGSGIASTRETDRISFSTFLGGDDKANDFQEALTDFALDTTFNYEELASVSKALLAYGYKQEELFPLLEKVGDTGSALGMSSEDMKEVAVALGRMKSAEEITLESLSPLLERNIDVWKYLAEDGMTEEQVKQKVIDGEISGEEVIQKISQHMGDNYGGSMEKQNQTYSGLSSTLEDANARLDSSMGEGYNSARESGLQEQIDWLSGDSGEEMQNAYNKIGQWKAYLENSKEQYQRDALNSVMTGTISDSYENSSQKVDLERLAEEYTKANDDYIKMSRLGDMESAKKANADMGRILAEAEAIAKNEYNASDGAQLALESNRTLAENIKNDTVAQDTYWDAGYTMSQKFTLGYESGMAARKKDQKEENGFILNVLTTIFGDAGESLYYDFKDTWGTPSGNGHAAGLSYVPYDNYPALLHQGERVLTASENRNHGSGMQVNITGNNFTVRNEDDIKKIGEEVTRQVARQFSQAFQLAI